MSQRPTTPDEPALQHAGDVGVRTVRAALCERISRRAARGGHEPRLLIALLFGGLFECAQQIAAATDPSARDAVERGCFAYVRGAVRGAGGPINEDGSHYGDW